MDSTVANEPSLEVKAFEVRKLHFDNAIQYYAPGLKRFETSEFKQSNPEIFQSISVTGSACALNCDHCDKKIIEPMIPVNNKEGLFELCRKLKEKGTETVLVSGGSMKNGQVPFMKHIEDIKRVREELGMKIMMHTGVVDEAMAKGLKDAGVDGVALDIIGAQETIKDVYHMDASVEDFDQSMKLLTDYGLSIRPHIILGLHFGKFLGEYAALDLIKKYNIGALILVILVPMHDTPMQNEKPPSTEEVETFFQKARIAMPDTKILIGCARPGGEYKEIVDKAAIDAGLNGIAYPAEGIIEYSRTKGLNPEFYEHACSCGVDI
ncbi:MAG: radical SAM protein [Cytophagales bacterium]|nr:radical SAM protein [Cytophagales bacterium]